MTGLALTGCQSSKKTASAGKTSSSSAVAVASNLGHVAGQSYSGTHKGSSTSADLTYQYKITFNKDGSFGQEIISSNGYSARFIQQGTYKYNKSKKQVEIKITKVTETSYSSDSDLQSSSNPITLSVRTAKGQNTQTELTSAENKTLIIKDKGSYLLGTVNNVKLTKDKHPVTSFSKLASSETDAYSDKAQVVNQKTFYAKLGTSRIWISFNDDGTWQARIIDGTHKWDIFDQGTWSVKSGELVLTATGDIHEYTIVGDTTNPSKYSGVTTNSSRVTDNFTWKIDGSDLAITSKQDSSMTADMQIKASKVTKVYKTAQSQTTNSSSDSTEDVFGSQDVFIKWLNIHAGSASIVARNVSNSQAAKYEGRFTENYSELKPLYICELTDNSETKMKSSIQVYASNGKVYEFTNNSWAVSRYTDILSTVAHDKETGDLKADSQSDSSSSDTHKGLKFSSADEFVQWIKKQYGDGKDLRASNYRLSGEHYKWFKKAVDATPLYFVTGPSVYENGKKVAPLDAQWIYASDGNIYHQITFDAWQLDQDAMHKLTNRTAKMR